MIEKQLNIGDHIIDASGHVYVVEAVNKTTYRITRADGRYGSLTIPFHGKQRLGLSVLEYFDCDNVQLKIIADLERKNDELQQKVTEQEQELAEARTLKENLEWLRCGKLSDLEQRLDELEQRLDDLGN